MRADDVEELLERLVDTSEELKGVVRGILVEAVGRLPKPTKVVCGSLLVYSDEYLELEVQFEEDCVFIGLYSAGDLIRYIRLPYEPEVILSRIEGILETMKVLIGHFEEPPVERTK